LKGQRVYKWPGTTMRWLALNKHRSDEDMASLSRELEGRPPAASCFCGGGGFVKFTDAAPGRVHSRAMRHGRVRSRCSTTNNRKWNLLLRPDEKRPATSASNCAIPAEHGAVAGNYDPTPIEVQRHDQAPGAARLPEGHRRGRAGKARSPCTGRTEGDATRPHPSRFPKTKGAR